MATRQEQRQDKAREAGRWPVPQTNSEWRAANKLIRLASGKPAAKRGSYSQRRR